MKRQPKIDLREICPTALESLRWADEIVVNRFAEGGPLISVVYVGTEEEERHQTKMLVDIANRVKYRVEHGLPPE